MPRPRVLPLLSLSVASALFAADAPRTLDVPMHSIDDAGQPTMQRFAVPLRLTGCDGLFDVVSLETSLELDKKAQGRMLIIYVHADATLKKLAAGPAAPPELIVENDGKKVTVPFETIVADPHYEEAGAILHERLTSPELTLSAGWKSVELRCSSASPWRAPVIPAEVTYVRKPDAEVAAAVAKIRAAIDSPAGFGTPSLYDESVMMIGPELYKHLQHEPELATFRSPKMVTIDPQTKVSRSLLRAKGPEELALFHKVLTRYLGATTPRRLRPATSAELSAHWMNIGWDIDEPLLVLDTGAHRLVLDTSGDTVLMVDELP